ncbi:MAG: hypothetical protein F4Y03_09310 [Alphaproteobacteria bacterium]|nr:hypothetical protein [Alphaproteobacteria bacterium]
MAFGDHWTDRWLGRPWVEGTYDCVDFVKEVLAEQFGRRLRLPATPASARDWDRTVANLKADHGYRTPFPADGDGVLMMQAGARRQRGYHLGVAVRREGRLLVLHCPRNGSSVLTPAKDLRAAFQLELEGTYRWL